MRINQLPMELTDKILEGYPKLVYGILEVNSSTKVEIANSITDINYILDNKTEKYYSIIQEYTPANVFILARGNKVRHDLPLLVTWRRYDILRLVIANPSIEFFDSFYQLVRNDKEIIKILLDRPSNVVRNDLTRKLLYTYIDENNMDMITYVAMNTNAIEEIRHQLVIHAIIKNNIKCVEYIIGTSDTCIYGLPKFITTAVEHKREEILRYLLGLSKVRYGVDVFNCHLSHIVNDKIINIFRSIITSHTEQLPVLLLCAVYRKQIKCGEVIVDLIDQDELHDYLNSAKNKFPKLYKYILGKYPFMSNH